jgi:hypothetical protein
MVPILKKLKELYSPPQSSAGELFIHSASSRAFTTLDLGFLVKITNKW